MPTDFFYEWQKTPTGKQPFAIELTNGTPMGFAGLWERWKDRVAGDVMHTFTIITGPPNELVAPIHIRMPVIVPREAWRRWLGEEEAGADELLAPLWPYPADLMRAYVLCEINVSSCIPLPDQAPAAIAHLALDRCVSAVKPLG